MNYTHESNEYPFRMQCAIRILGFLHIATSKKLEISCESSSDKHLGNKKITMRTGTLRITAEMLRSIPQYLQSHSVVPFP